jgi:2-succinyl-6-hydroxy-2,4-cyclohexadiene-1-carboxylate synthase
MKRRQKDSGMTMTDIGVRNPPVVALHGFLGLKRDWDPLPLDVRAHDLWADVEQLRVESSENADGVAIYDPFQAWALRFNRHIEDSGLSKPVLLGYSMGGRLALHAALLAPEKFSALVIVSAHPGLQSEAEKKARLQADLLWAKRFREEKWQTVLEAWNSQPVLSRTQGLSLERAEADFSRENLAAAMDMWSLGRQRDLRSEISNLKVPLLFISGAQDEKFTAVMKDLVMHSLSGRLEIIPGAGHRVPWDRTDLFERVIFDFLKR